MKRNQLVFFVIIGVALLIVAVTFVLQSSDSDDTPDTPSNAADTPPDDQPDRTRDPIRIEVAVNPLLEDWASDAASAYNATSPTVENVPVTVTVRSVDSFRVWQASPSAWSPQSHPTAWIPLANYELQLANENSPSVSFTVVSESLGETPIIWGAYQSRADVILNKYDTLNSDVVQQIAGESWQDVGGTSRWGNVKLAFTQPNSAANGAAVLLTLAADYHQSATLTVNNLNDAALRDWLTTIIDGVPNFSTLGIDPAITMSTRGVSAGEIALLPEMQWLIHYDTFNEPVQLFYPAYGVVFDFPFAVWADANDDDTAAAEGFAAFLASNAQQRALVEQGVRAATISDLDSFEVFAPAQASVPTQAVTPPNVQTVKQLLNAVGQ